MEAPKLDWPLEYWLRSLSNCVSQDLAARFAPKGVTMAEADMMWVLSERGPMAPSSVADEMGMTRGAISRLTDRLCKKSLVRCRGDEEDGRAQILALTKKGRQLVPQLTMLASETRLRVFGPLAERDQKLSVEMLKEVVEDYRAAEDRRKAEGRSGWGLDERTRGHISDLARKGYEVERIAAFLGVGRHTVRNHPEMMDIIERVHRERPSWTDRFDCVPSGLDADQLAQFRRL